MIWRNVGASQWLEVQELCCSSPCSVAETGTSRARSQFAVAAAQEKKKEEETQCLWEVLFVKGIVHRVVDRTGRVGTGPGIARHPNFAWTSQLFCVIGLQPGTIPTLTFLPHTL